MTSKKTKVGRPRKHKDSVDLFKLGAFGDALRLLASGYSMRPILSQLQLDHPNATRQQLLVVYNMAAQAVAAAGQYKMHGGPGKPTLEEIPRLPEG